MCGIAGILRLTDPNPIPRQRLERMIHALAHRGPDEFGIYQDDSIGLAHSRLSIIDLASGSQPIHNEARNLWISFNGEIFNYVELRKDLEKRGHEFYTSSDTEVIVHLFEEEGPDCLQSFNGQFALAIWDNRKEELFLARDRVGIRPLHYTFHNGSLIFASEVKSIFQVEGLIREFDPTAINEIFTFWTTLPGNTVFQGIHEIPPGHYMTVSTRGTFLKQYWEIPFCQPADQFDGTPDEAVDRIQETLTDAIRIRLRADVPVGCYLSGGLDSSGIASLLVKNGGTRLKTFGVRFEDDAFDEGHYQNQMVSFLGTTHEEILATNEQIGGSFPSVLWHCEKPLLRTSSVPLFLLSKRVREKEFKVVLTGEGADEIFAGYHLFREVKVRRFCARGPESPFRATLIKKLYPYIFKDPKLEQILIPFFRKGLDRVNEPLFSHHLRWENTSRLKAFLSDSYLDAARAENPYEKLEASLPQDFQKWDYLSKAQYLEMNLFLSNYLLSSQGDRVAMANSVEIRMPYLDPRMISLAVRFPPQLKLRFLDEKHILKESFRGLLPPSIREREKHPYRAPIHRALLSESLNETREEVLSDTSLRESGVFNPGKVRQFLKKVTTAASLSEVDNMVLAGILSTQIVHRQFIQELDRVSPSQPVEIGAGT